MKYGSDKTKYPGRIFALIILPLLLAVFVFCTVGVIKTWGPARAERLMASGAFLEAAEQYRASGNDVQAEHCLALHAEQSYFAAVAEFASGQHRKAREDFEALGDYRDSEKYILACDYSLAQELMEQGQYYEARELCGTLEGYPGQELLLEKCSEGLYDIAMGLALDGSYEQAAELWRELGDFRDCPMLLFRIERMQSWLEGEARLIDEAKLYNSAYYKNVYKSEHAYIVVPDDCSPDCRFFIYYPGGTDEEINIDFLNYYLMNPVPDTVAVFMRRNGLKNMAEKNSQALEILEQAAAECGVFIREIMVLGSSMGAYPAMHSPRYSMRELGIRVDCVLSLDAGADWDTIYVMSYDECFETAEIATEYYLFESPWVGMNRSAIEDMVYSGIPVTMVGCSFDEHVRITLDAMGMGVLHWALSDRTEPCGLDIYTFTRLM